MVKKGQGSLEYLIIIAAVLVVSGLVVYLVTGSAGGSKKDILFSNCQAAAQQCKLLKAANPNDICAVCDDQCIEPATGDELFVGSVACCKSGNASGIFVGSTGCTDTGAPDIPAVACSGVNPCPPVGTGTGIYECYAEAICDSNTGLCYFRPSGGGAMCGTDTDCKIFNCDGVGNCVSTNRADTTPCTDEGNECTIDECASGICSHTPRPNDYPCTGGSCQSGNCITFGCVNNDGNCPGFCDASNDNDCSSVALAGSDMTGPDSFSSPFAGTATGGAICGSQVDHSYSFDGGALCSTTPTDEGYRSVHYSSSSPAPWTSVNTGTGVHIRTLSGVPVGVPLDVTVSSDFSVSLRGSFGVAVYASGVASNDIGDGNWMPCGGMHGGSYSSSSTGTVSGTCNGIVSQSGDLFIAYSQGVSWYNTGNTAVIYGRTMDVTYAIRGDLKGESALGAGATSVASYEWDFDYDGTFTPDWTSNSSLMTPKYSNIYTYYGSATGGAICGSQIYWSDGFDGGALCSTTPTDEGYRSVHYSSSSPAPWTSVNTGTGIHIIGSSDAPVGVPLDVTVSSDFSVSLRGSFSVAVYASGVASNDIGDGNWHQCGSLTGGSYSSSSTGTVSGTCNGIVSQSGDLFIAYSQGVSWYNSGNTAVIYGRIISVSYESAPGINAWTTYAYPIGTTTSALRMTDNLGVTDIDTVQITVTP